MSVYNPLTFGTFAALSVWIFIINQVYKSNIHEKILRPLLFSFSLIVLLIFARELPFLPQFIKDLFFLSSGSYLTSSMLLTIGLIFLFSLSINKFRSKKFKSDFENYVNILLIILFSSGIGLSIWRLFTDYRIFLINPRVSWEILLENYKSLKYFLLGVGPGNYSYAYNIGKPIAVNLTAYWEATANSASNLLFQLATEAGFIVLISLLFVVFKISKNHFTNKNKSELPVYFLSFAVAFILQFIFPTNIVLISVLFILLSLSESTIVKSKLRIPNPQIVFIVINLILATFAFFVGRIYYSEIIMRQALSHAQNNDLENAYILSQKSVSINQENDLIFSYASKINYALANAISNSSQASQSAEIIKNIKTQQLEYIDRATQMNSLSSQNWELLGNTYSELIGSLENADQTTIRAFQTLDALNPNSPKAKMYLANLFFNYGQLDDAKNLYFQSLKLKPDLNVAHYNLSRLYQNTGNLDGAKIELERAMDSTDSNSEIYSTMKTELESLNTLIANQATISAQTTLTPAPKTSK
jgi:tetratricopeptide (TPR) repeat protein